MGITINTKTTLSAIVMFAAVLGMVAFTPAFAEKNAVSYCHYDEVVNNPDITKIDESLDSDWIVITVSGASQGHEKHGDSTVTGDETEYGTPAYWCVTNQDGTVTEPEPEI